ncbi:MULTISPECIES: MarR family winged helix-turn-helix transcriptional regulator [unclassified Streptomyces]|uniref:MarR family winged helix-turn-helix transcriptional regulator n=1 Tax=unclassified Streptomyces TaxID=2593676 RepID=UPI002255B242|nr:MULTISPECIES: MarR family transcriptional regulator [unclassified Streptomyces]WSP57915.1 MarR family transcriptional regulator [Streptomyces sp. NBC_01241]WSU21347.1 MarR family transcriptional regulator [Streptomyces sp. NBC_01108]MCX4789834.1 MarR family transcriptional regulator [Streptomyces sp. NBC_01221]MCX4794464.1 MarR family transcriptional regulator [Streptomyces sp. NBC_01242]WSJ35810.1 MarR family transcriptional regulator [Streptomyces sp. NBC_01321]
MSDFRASTQDLDRVATVLTACLPALNRALDRRVAQDFAQPKPPEGQLALLRFVSQQEGATVRQAADALLMRPNNVSALVSQLTEQGLLERRRDAGDKRIAHLYPTSRARRELAEVRRLEGAHMSQALQSLTDGEMDALGSALGALTSLARHLRPVPAAE